MDVFSTEGGFGAPVDFKIILEQLQTDDIMFHYEGVSTLKIALQSSDEKSLLRFPFEGVCKKLVEIIRQPSEMEI